MERARSCDAPDETFDSVGAKLRHASGRKKRRDN